MALRRPYRKYLVSSLVFNLLSAVLNVFSFLSIIPMLNLLFRLDTSTYSYIPWDAPGRTSKTSW